MSIRYDWVTSLKPSRLEVLEKINPLLLDFPENQFGLKCLNNLDEMSLPKGAVEQVSVGFSKRPSLRNLLENVTTEVGVLSNSDILPYFKNVDELSALAGGCWIWLGRRYDIEPLIDMANVSRGQYRELAGKVGFRQSPFTIDLFILTRKAIDLLLQEDWLDDYFLGSPGIDMKLAEFSFVNGIGKRYDNFLTILHPNHESYRVNFKTNIVTDLKSNLAFSKKRGEAFTGRANSINLAYLEPKLQKIHLIRYYVSIFDSLVNKLRNICQYNTSRLSEILWQFYSANRIPFRLYLIINVLIPLPSLHRHDCESLRQMAIRRISKIANGVINE